MTARDLFALAVRLLGLWMLWTTVNTVLASLFGPIDLRFGILFWQAIQGFVGLILLRGAPALVDFAYPESSSTHAPATPRTAPPSTPLS